MLYKVLLCSDWFSPLLFVIDLQENVNFVYYPVRVIQWSPFVTQLSLPLYCHTHTHTLFFCSENVSKLEGLSLLRDNSLVFLLFQYLKSVLIREMSFDGSCLVRRAILYKDLPYKYHINCSNNEFHIFRNLDKVKNVL